MKYIKKFENGELPKLREDFSRLLEIADWREVIDNKTGYSKKDQIFIEACYARVFKEYEYHEIKKFRVIYEMLYNQLYDFFKNDWLKNPGYGISDDGYSDLISSIIGMGEKYINKCLKNKDIVKNMVDEDYYKENFGYLFNVDFKQYDEIRCKYDEGYRMRRKYNL